MNPIQIPPMKLQKITLTGLRARGTHGVLPAEHEQAQDFVVDVSMEVCVQDAIANDDIARTISYADVADAVVAVITGPHVNLIETLADQIAEQVTLLGARTVTVTVHKPQAPINHQFADVSTTVSVPGPLLTPARRRIVVGVGSNLDMPEAHVIAAVRALTQVVDIENVSALYRTAPQLALGQEIQPDYVNAVVTGYIHMPPLEFLHVLQHIEAEHGRVRTQRWAARTLDLDVIDVAGMSSADPELLIPHPRAATRRFVIEPWLAIDPAATLAGEPLADILPRLSDQRVARMDPAEYLPRVRKTIEEWERTRENGDDLPASADWEERAPW